MSTETITIPRCPVCNSALIHREMRPYIGMETEGDTTYMLNGSIDRCQTCGHAWNRTARRGVGLKNYPLAPKPKPGFWARLFTLIK